jgi:glycerate kinase
MKIAVAPDSFKGSLSAMEAAECIERGLRQSLKGVSIRKIPMADGGEGTVRAIVEATGGRMVRRSVSDPLGRRIRACFGMSGDGKTAVIEMAAASGLALLKPGERNPLLTTTRGTGEMIRHALAAGARRILVGIGGSATNDGGTGMARALGARFLDGRGRQLREGGGSLANLERVDMSRMDKRVARTHVEVACDVDNPLVGPRGAARVYAPQKGATPAMVRELDVGLRQLARVIRRDLNVDILNVPGSGAAGGLGAGLMAFLGGELRPGVDIVTDTVGLRRRLRGCDLVITGEGRMDGQTVYGKTPAGVAKAAGELGIPVIAICGSLGKGVQAVLGAGIHAYFSALQEPVAETDLPARGPDMLTDCAAQVGRMIALDFVSRPGIRKRK